MFRQRVAWLTGAVLAAAAFVWMVPAGRAGEHVRAGDQPVNQTPRSTAPSARPLRVTVAAVPVTVAVAVTRPAQPATEPVYVNLRGPNGEVRRFAVEGGRDVIPTQPVTVLRPGQSVTIQVAVRK